jgi:hypothetical protein
MIARITGQDWPHEVAAHALEQLGELRTALNVKLKSEAEATRRLSVGLEGFERRLTQMARRHLDSRPEGR